MTLTSFPGAFFLVSAAITVPVLLIFAWFYWQVRKEQSEDLKQSLADDGETGGGGDILNLDDGGDSTDSEASGTATPEHKERY
ncbi:unnamed protein product [Orchesella dallaii]|uniref:Uncharacterized protein n=1 Tax=Orchesella dallaii TaxID=48710 RepID=A0ABP1S2L6_9HEXA